MRDKRYFKSILLSLAFLLGINLLLFFSPFKAKTHETLVTQSTYFGPTEPIPGDPQLIKVELLIKDSPDLAGVQIQSVIFNGQAIPLKPRDIFGNRGGASFQLPAGTYSLRWTVKRDKLVWPRTQSYQEEVILSPKDLWVQILIEGEKASIR